MYGNARRASFVLIAMNLALLIAPVAAYPPVLQQHRAAVLLLEPVLALLAYAGLAVAITRRETGLRYATAWGGVSGLFSVAQIVQETYLHKRALLTWIFIIGMLLPWLLAGHQARTIRAGVWSAMISVLLTIAFGWSEFLWDLPGVIARNIGSPDLARSGWTDLHAYGIVDLLQAGFKYLLFAPLIGVALGALGACVRYPVEKLPAKTSQLTIDGVEERSLTPTKEG